MAFRIRGSYIAAAVFAGAVIGWMATGEVVVGGQAGSADATPPPAARQEADDAAFQVRYAMINPEQRAETLTIRGRTSADSVVSVRAETAGTVEERLVAKGDRVEKGDLVCRLDKGARESAVAQAEAALAQARFDYEANQKLQERGFAASTQLNALKAALDGAEAQLDQARQELARTEIKATASGIVQAPVAETGDNLGIGDVCVTVIDTEPMLFVGQVSERSIGALESGDRAIVTLVSGEQREGHLRYIAPSADPQTRTFLVEIVIENGEGSLRDGVTAAAEIELDPREAYRVDPSWLTLGDDGTIGLRTIGEENTVGFMPVEILAQTTSGVWVTGPEPETRVIALGQDYVTAGQKVEPVEEVSLDTADSADSDEAEAGARS